MDAPYDGEAYPDSGNTAMDGECGDEVMNSFRIVPGKRWCLVQTRPRNEKWTRNALAAEHITIYLPLLTKVEIHNRGKRKLLLPMFPGYLFACADRDEETAIRQNRCVWNLRTLSEAEEDSLIRDLRAVRLCELQSADHQLVVNPGLQAGDMVRIRSGAFKGQDAVVIRRVDAVSVIVNLSFLGRNIDVRWEAGDLEY